MENYHPDAYHVVSPDATPEAYTCSLREIHSNLADYLSINGCKGRPPLASKLRPNSLSDAFGAALVIQGSEWF